MKKVMFIRPWNYHDENISLHNLCEEWRNGPYNLLCLATQLKVHNIPVKIVDLEPILVHNKGKLDKCLEHLYEQIMDFRPDIIGVSFFSFQLDEVKSIVEFVRNTCSKLGLNSIFLAGGIHASIEPLQTIEELGFDYAFVGEGDLGIIDLALCDDPTKVKGIISSKLQVNQSGEEVLNLNDLPFPDWSLCDYKFYSTPSIAKTKVKIAKTLDLMMGRGCVNKCKFCAYSALSSVRFYSAEYLVKQIEDMIYKYDIDSVYFIDSSIGNNRRLLSEFCNLMIETGVSKKIQWFANIRANQVDEEILKLMWTSGCRLLFYGFESGSQKILNAMNKGCTVEQNIIASKLHEKLKFPYHASILLGYPNETEEDILLTFEFLKSISPTNIGVNWYVPLPGSNDYEELRKKGLVKFQDTHEWRRIGEALENGNVYAEIDPDRFKFLYKKALSIANEAIISNSQFWFGDSIKENRINMKYTEVLKGHDDINKRVKVCIFGASGCGKYIYDEIQKTNKNFQCKIDIKIYMDNDPQKWCSKLNNIQIMKPSKEYIDMVDYVIIASNWKLEIKEQLINLGVKEEKILFSF